MTTEKLPVFHFKRARILTCTLCAVRFQRTGPRQRYCADCAAERKAERHAQYEGRLKTERAERRTRRVGLDMPKTLDKHTRFEDDWQCIALVLARKLEQLEREPCDPPTFSLEEIGQLFGMTRERARQLEASALHKLRAALRLRGIRELTDLAPEPAQRRGRRSA